MFDILKHVDMEKCSAFISDTASMKLFLVALFQKLAHVTKSKLEKLVYCEECHVSMI